MYYSFSCPVPKKQRPINEYMELIKSNFFNWPIQKKPIFIYKIFKTYSFFFFFCFPFSNFFEGMNQSLSRILLLNASLSTFFIVLVLVRLFLGWTYIKTRLYEPAVFYEESGWYDGRVWVKSKSILVQDRFIYTYQVLPTIKKLKQILLLSSAFLLSFIFLLVLS